MLGRLLLRASVVSIKPAVRVVVRAAPLIGSTPFASRIAARAGSVRASLRNPPLATRRFATAATDSDPSDHSDAGSSGTADMPQLLSRGGVLQSTPFRLAGYRFAESVNLPQLQSYLQRAGGHTVTLYTTPNTRHHHKHFTTAAAAAAAAAEAAAKTTARAGGLTGGEVPLSPSRGGSPYLLHVSYRHSALTQISAPPDTSEGDADTDAGDESDVSGLLPGGLPHERSIKDLYVTNDGVLVAWGQTPTEELAWRKILESYIEVSLSERTAELMQSAAGAATGLTLTPRTTTPANLNARTAPAPAAPSPIAVDTSRGDDDASGGGVASEVYTFWRSDDPLQPSAISKQRIALSEYSGLPAARAASAAAAVDGSVPSSTRIQSREMLVVSERIARSLVLSSLEARCDAFIRSDIGNLESTLKLHARDSYKTITGRLYQLFDSRRERSNMRRLLAHESFIAQRLSVLREPLLLASSSLAFLPPLPLPVPRPTTDPHTRALQSQAAAAAAESSNTAAAPAPRVGVASWSHRDWSLHFTALYGSLNALLRVPQRIDTLEHTLEKVRQLTRRTSKHQHKRRMWLLSWVVILLIITTLMVETGLEKTAWWGDHHDDDDDSAKTRLPPKRA